MTNQQIAYRNLAIAQQQADAATAQAAAAKKKVDHETGKGFVTNVVTGALSTAGGLLALALI